MVYLVDNFIDQYLFKALQDKLNSNDYIEHKTPGKSFCVKEPSAEFIAHFEDRLDEIEV